jgi:hypothetical protein
MISSRGRSPSIWTCCATDGAPVSIPDAINTPLTARASRVSRPCGAFTTSENRSVTLVRFMSISPAECLESKRQD